jgi:anti-sigma regulatory factor (Ser/Thr protein kinase)
MVSELKFAARNQPEDIRRVRGEIDLCCQGQGVSDPIRIALDLALEECLTNILKYAFDDAGEHAIHIRLRISNQEVRIVVEDDGKPFNPLDQSPPDTTIPLEERIPGGLGIFLIRKSVDTVEYQRVAGKNVLLLAKRKETP